MDLPFPVLGLSLALASDASFLRGESESHSLDFEQPGHLKF